MTFREFMKQRRAGGSAVYFRDGPSDMSRDFIGDALSDKTLPNIKTFDQLYRHMRGLRACDGAIEGALDTFADWTLYRISEGTFETADDEAFTRKLARKGRHADKLAMEEPSAADDFEAGDREPGDNVED